MALSNSERQRLFRARRDADPDKRKKYIQKGRDRYQRDCNSGKIKPIEQLSREKGIKDILNSIHTPPFSPEHEPAEIHISSRQKEQQRKKKRREESKSYRQRQKMQLEINNLKRKVEMYKKRLSRKQQQENKHQQDTPRRRTRKLLRKFTPKDQKKSLSFKCQVLIEAIR
ncbi:hypothetical protein MAR_016323 [Mya arenaria]|uniref:Uncharacterized protein n=1 Tax=Mya arenaria TaxID=6604 RepID=A0ABY7FLX7_MYAAR|nr:hypothetical protein MAR_016323 [Mya arenaria]